MRRVRRKKQRSPVFVLVAGNEVPRFQHFLGVQEWRSARQNQLVGLAQVDVSAERRVAENKRNITPPLGFPQVFGIESQAMGDHKLQGTMRRQSAIRLEDPIKTIEGVGSEELRCFQGSVSAQAIQIFPVSYTHLTLPTIYSV